MQDFMDYSEEAVSYEVADTGIYELEIENAELKKSESGKNFIALTYIVRDDVEQDFAGTYNMYSVTAPRTFRIGI